MSKINQFIFIVNNVWTYSSNFIFFYLLYFFVPFSCFHFSTCVGLDRLSLLPIFLLNGLQIINTI